MNTIPQMLLCTSDCFCRFTYCIPDYVQFNHHVHFYDPAVNIYTVPYSSKTIENGRQSKSHKKQTSHFCGHKTWYCCACVFETGELTAGQCIGRYQVLHNTSAGRYPRRSMDIHYKSRVTLSAGGDTQGILQCRGIPREFYSAGRYPGNSQPQVLRHYHCREIPREFLTLEHPCGTLTIMILYNNFTTTRHKNSLCYLITA